MRPREFTVNELSRRGQSSGKYPVEHAPKADGIVRSPGSSLVNRIIAIRRSNFVIRHSRSSLLLFAASVSRSGPTPSPPPNPTVAAPGSIAAFYTADLYAKESGYITEVLADIGDHVKKGAVLAVIDNPELQQQLLAAQAMAHGGRRWSRPPRRAIHQSEAAMAGRQEAVGRHRGGSETRAADAQAAGGAVLRQGRDGAAARRDARAKAQVTGAARGRGAGEDRRRRGGRARRRGESRRGRGAGARRGCRSAAAADAAAVHEDRRAVRRRHHPALGERRRPGAGRHRFAHHAAVQLPEDRRRPRLLRRARIAASRGIRPGVGGRRKLYGPAGRRSTAASPASPPHSIPPPAPCGPRSICPTPTRALRPACTPRSR